MAVTKMPKEAVYEPDTDGPSLFPVPVDPVLDQRLIAKQNVDTLAAKLKEAAFVFDPDDQVTIVTAESLAVVDADEYARGYELLEELSDIENRIGKWYARFDKPLTFLTNVVRGLKSPQVAQVAPIKTALSKRLGKWKAEQERLDRLRREEAQRVADLAAKAAQEAKAAVLDRVAEQEPNEKLAASFRAEAELVRNVDVHGALVETQSSVPKVAGGYTVTRWKCEFLDLKVLMTAYVEGRCIIPDEALIEGLQGYMDKQAGTYAENLSKAFPGTRAVPDHGAVKRRAR